MSKIKVVLDNLSDWNAYYPSSQIVTADDFLAAQQPIDRDCLIINLCRTYKYLSYGYYCSLLAESRRQKVMPPIRTISDLSKKTLYTLSLDELNKALNRLLNKSTTTHQNQVNIRIYFGITPEETLQEFARQLFETFPCPLLEVEFKKTAVWSINAIRTVPINSLTDVEEDHFATALDRFSGKIWRKPRARKNFSYDLAILVNADETLPPSNKQALKRFEKIGRELSMDVDFVSKKDLGKLAEYDALFIRETTSIGDHTYQFSKRAESEGMAVIDDPDSILRCTNKVYLANLFSTHHVPTPKTIILNRHNKNACKELEAQLDFPMVLKIPDGSFSRGIVKATNSAELHESSQILFAKSALILAQEYYYTDYDWRIGILNGIPLFACQYFMSKGHWQIYNHKQNGIIKSGDFATFPVNEAPQHVIKNATKAAKLIGNGLYGVDLKQRDSASVVIEVNDNPNIDAGVEDKLLGENLYRMIIQELVSRIEAKRTRATA